MESKALALDSSIHQIDITLSSIVFSPFGKLYLFLVGAKNGYFKVGQSYP
jgi:hypothetical protein